MQSSTHFDYSLVPEYDQLGQMTYRMVYNPEERIREIVACDPNAEQTLRRILDELEQQVGTEGND